ncbi:MULTISPECIES: branched-chain amino acid ABC transporter permease [unclassified Variovorax]|uniref:branched-chain amino acid ABC transporter permease n=1 Tax=unclassified Variovorax TaxID=663243 RepID=UPI00257551FB|nr:MULTISPECIES: branched-chain amino acid ABC transporter permease [unclassified Variovorax]MDM0090014.1 branched-chain amino acid ABC transporter permease [Variovorax sp. J22G40]MDM0148320.1 branched-chain amino acid ABC transporter permease [Variovorax sp. J2P1-31]
MDTSLAILLTQDGIVTGAIYALLATALVLVFSITHVPFVPLGGFVTFTALTLVAIQEQRTPLVAWVVVTMGVLCFLLELGSAWRSGTGGRTILAAAGKYLLAPVALSGLAVLASRSHVPVPVGMLAACLLIVPIGPMIYRLAFQPLIDSDPLTFFMLSIAVEVAMIGVGLVLFGPEGARTEAYTDFQLTLGELVIPGQSLFILGAAVLLTVGLFFFFNRTIRGKMLRATAVNRTGAQLMGISVVRSGQLAFTLAALIGAICGLLIAPRITLNYSSGLMIGMKGFIAAVVGGFVSYPIAALGALLIGLLESFSSFWMSAWKEVIVFTLIIPVLLFRTLHGGDSDDTH